MPESTGELPADVKAALERGDSVDAIRLLRQSTGLGLKEAKEAIAQYLRGNPAVLASAVAAAVSMPPAAAEAMLRGNKLEAIRLLREHTGLGLKEAKDAVGASSDAQTSAKRSLGEQPQGVSSGWWFVLLIVAAFVVYYVIRRAG